MKLIVESWGESERGWGTRPDGYAVYLNMAERKAYVDIYWDSMPDHTPDEYSFPVGSTKEIEVTNPEILAEVQKNGYYRTYEESPQWLKS